MPIPSITACEPTFTDGELTGWVVTAKGVGSRFIGADAVCPLPEEERPAEYQPAKARRAMYDGLDR